MKRGAMAFLSLLLLIAIPAISVAQDVLVFAGTPLIRGTASYDNSSNIELSKDQRKEFRLVIMKTPAGYRWASRENRPLNMKESGNFTHFVEPNGAGYIKIAKSKDRFLYMEHVSTGFQTHTYWGTAQSFTP